MGTGFEIDAKEGVIYSVAEGTLGLEDIQDNRENCWPTRGFTPNSSKLLSTVCPGLGFPLKR